MPTPQYFLEVGAPKLQFIPIVIADDGNYPLEPNTYLVERSCGEWAISNDGDPIVPTLKSRQVMASRLCAFLHFCSQSEARDWRTMTYQDGLLSEYQPGLLKGTCSATKKPLRAASVNAYLDEAVLFLSWAAERGHRPPFKVPHRRLRLTGETGGSVGKLILQRHGKLQEVSEPLSDLPSAAEVQRWLAGIRIRAPVKALQFELILRTGARLSEVNEMRISCFPNKEFKGSERGNDLQELSDRLVASLANLGPIKCICPEVTLYAMESGQWRPVYAARFGG